MISRAINQKTARHLAYEAFLDLARNLDCVGVEPRNDLGRPLFDGISPSRAGAMARQRGLRLLGLSEVYPFNDWSEERANAIETLIAAAVESRAETISLIPGRWRWNGRWHAAKSAARGYARSAADAGRAWDRGTHRAHRLCRFVAQTQSRTGRCHRAVGGPTKSSWYTIRFNIRSLVWSNLSRLHSNGAYLGNHRSLAFA